MRRRSTRRGPAAAVVDADTSSVEHDSCDKTSTVPSTAAKTLPTGDEKPKVIDPESKADQQPAANTESGPAPTTQKRKVPSARAPPRKIAYMEHSAMQAKSEATSTARTASKTKKPANSSDCAVELTTLQAAKEHSSLEILSSVAPPLLRKANAARARKDNISLEEQANRSAEMCNIVATKTTLRDQLNSGRASTSKDGADDAEKGTASVASLEKTKSLYYSETDDSDANIVVLPRPSARTTTIGTAHNNDAKKPSSYNKLFPNSRKRQLGSGTSNNLIVGQRGAGASKEDGDARSAYAASLYPARIPTTPSDRTVELFRRHSKSGTGDILKRARAEAWEEHSALENADDVGSQPVSGAHLCKKTSSSAMAKRKYSVYGINNFFRDRQFQDDVELERKLFGTAVQNLCRVNGKPNDARAAQRQIERAGHGRALVTMQSFCASAAQADDQPTDDASSTPKPFYNLTTRRFRYPLQTDVRCSYDHHRFTTIPIFLPLAFHSDRNLVTLLSSICFCSFSCAKSWICQQAPSTLRNDASHNMLSLFAKRYFGITEQITPAQSLLEHEDYGGTQNTREWRSAALTHHSMLRQPMSIAVPSTVVTEVYVRSRKDANKVTRISKRTEETHFDSIPERPERNSADAAEAAKRKLKEGEGRPLKERQAIDKETGERVPIDKKLLDSRINSACAERKRKADDTRSSTVAVRKIVRVGNITKQQAKRRKASVSVAKATGAKSNNAAAGRAKKKAANVSGSAVVRDMMKSASPKNVRLTPRRRQAGSAAAGPDGNVSLSQLYKSVEKTAVHQATCD